MFNIVTIMSTPSLSIITVVLNSVEIIEETIESVVKQIDQNIEYMIIDGGSTDGTVEIIKKYQKFLSFWCSEKDKGIYYAMNKGVEKGSGKFFYFINAGDILYTLPLIELEENINDDLLVFPVEVSNGKIIQPTSSNELKLKNTLPHQGCFYKNKSYLKFDERFEVFADWHLNQYYKRTGKKITIFQSPIIALHSDKGVSHSKEKSSELFKVVKDNYGLIYMIYSFLYFKINGITKRLKM